MLDHERVLRKLINDPLQVHCRNLPLSAPPCLSIADIRTRGWRALEGDLLFPLLLLKSAALASNIEVMRQYCLDAKVHHAPHAKTSMAPQIVWQLIDSGVWGTSIANIDHARVMRRFGVPRLLMANQLIEPQGLRWVAEELAADPDFEFWCLVDSPDGISLMDAALGGLPRSPKLPVLIEIGVEGGRAGCRNGHEIAAVARAVHRSRNLELRGVELYEAMAAKGGTSEEKRASVDVAMEVVCRGLLSLIDDGMLDTSKETIVTAGGSLYFDRVVAATERLSERVPGLKVVLRGGCCVTHEVGENDWLSPIGTRSSADRRLRQALELWGLVLSRPEPGLAILNFGKRDAPFDKGLPVAFARKRRGSGFERWEGAARILSLNDQHARVAVPDEVDLAPGDLVGFHIAHPCTAFDKWRLVPVVDDDYAVRDAILTFF